MISFIYEWLDTKTGLKYLGRHVGDFDDGYVGSGTIFKKEYFSRPDDFVRNILWQENYSTDERIKEKEDEYLQSIPPDQLYHGINRKYYNQTKNSWGFTSTDNPMNNKEVVARMIATQKEKNLRSPYHNTIEKYGIDGWKKINCQNKLGNTNGKGNKGKPKSEEHKKKIAESRKRQKNNRGGRKSLYPYQELINLVEKKGYEESANELGISLAALKNRYYTAKSKLNNAGVVERQTPQT